MKATRSIVKKERGYENDVEIVENITSWVRYLYADKEKMNFDPIYQRGLVWTLKQKREYILALFSMTATISPTIVCETGNKSHDDTLEILDGKQRLSTIFDFIENKFSILVDGEEFYFNELLEEDQKFLWNYKVHYRRVTSRHGIGVVPLKHKLMLFLEANALGTKATNEDIAKVEVLFDNLKVQQD